jgi:predicted TIM-barrel fold metal-dependent hydrolase
MSIEIIDIHPHIIASDATRYPVNPIRGQQSDWSAARPQTFEKLIAEMDEAGIAKAAIVQASTYYGFDNSYVADAVAQEPKRFTGVCTIDVFAAEAVETLEGWRKRGMTGLRLFTGGATHATDASWLTDPKSFPVWEYAADRNIPVCIQTSSEALDKVSFLCKQFPSAMIILDHIGRPKLDDGAPYAAAGSLFALSEFSNLYCKITPRTNALSKTGKATPETFFPALVKTFGADRIAWGSNLPANEGPMKALVRETLDCLASLSESDRAKILSGTAKKLYPALA